MCVMPLMEELHLYGWYLMLIIQKYFKDYTKLMLVVTKAADPRYSFLLYFPIVYNLRRSTGTQVLWVACISEWLNAVFKWILHGERPYWWVHETFHWKTKEELEAAGQLPKQFNLTCEIGPGSPSGHVMITGAVVYVMCVALIKHVISNTRYRGEGRVFVWSLFVQIMTAVAVSRVYISTHFPHQVIAGIIAAVYLGEYVKEDDLRNLQLGHYVMTGGLFSVGAAAIFYFIQYLGLDPMWSIKLAEKWCADPKWVHMDTSLFFSVVRAIACLTGFGFGDLMARKLRVDNLNMSLVSRVLQIGLSILLTLTLDGVKVPHDTDELFYTYSFVKFFVMMSSVAAIIPWILYMMGYSSKVHADENKKKQE